MRRHIALIAAAAALASAGVAAAAPSVEVRDAVARVTVIPENRSDIQVEVISANPQLPLSVRTLGARTIVDGNLDRKIRGCEGRGGSIRVDVRNVGEVVWREMPQVVIRTPRDVNLDAGGAVWGSVGRSNSLKLGNAGCGDWVIGNVSGSMTISQAGSGGARAGSAGEARVRVAGSGDVVVGDVEGPVAVDIAGSGDVRVASVKGGLSVHTAGSGDVRVASGQVDAMTASIAGSGNVDFGGQAATLKARIAGSGDVRAKVVTGEVSRSIMGAGRVSVGP